MAVGPDSPAALPRSDLALAEKSRQLRRSLITSSRLGPPALVIDLFIKTNMIAGKQAETEKRWQWQETSRRCGKFLFSVL
jgi:hypothetical protein